MGAAGLILRWSLRGRRHAGRSRRTSCGDNGGDNSRRGHRGRKSE